MSEKQEIKRIPKDSVIKHPQTIIVEVPVIIDSRDGLRNEIAFMKTLMHRHSGAAQRFAKEMNLA